MSLEQSMQALADANLKLATALEFYADTVNKYGLKITEANENPKADAPTEDAKPRGRGRPKATPAPEPTPEPEPEVDAFGEDEEEIEQKTITQADVKNILKQVRDQVDMPTALAILSKFGYRAIPEVAPKDFEAIYNAATKALK